MSYFEQYFLENIVRYYANVLWTICRSIIEKPSVEKKLAPNVGSLKSNCIRKWCSNYHCNLPRGRSPPLNKKWLPSRRMGVVHHFLIWLLSKLPTFRARFFSTTGFFIGFFDFLSYISHYITFPPINISHYIF